MTKTLNQLLREAKKTKIETDPDVEDLYTHEVNELHLGESAQTLSQLQTLISIIEARNATLGESVSLEEATLTTGINEYVNEMYEFITSNEKLAGYLNTSK